MYPVFSTAWSNENIITAWEFLFEKFSLCSTLNSIVNFYLQNLLERCQNSMAQTSVQLSIFTPFPEFFPVGNLLFNPETKTSSIRKMTMMMQIFVCKCVFFMCKRSNSRCYPLVPMQNGRKIVKLSHSLKILQSSEIMELPKIYNWF